MLSASSLHPAGSELSPLLPHRAPAEDARVDMTAMIDLVFMMNIFFLVTSLVAAMAEVNLPAAKHVVAADLETSVVLTVMAAEGRAPVVYVGDGAGGEPLGESQQEERITQAVAAQLREGKTAVIIKAEGNVPMRDIARIAAAASAAEGVKLNFAVMEKDD
ncbi:MAG: biopolymer transporter ExbD [Planctomycetia bacterium]|nr:biopolymer transporter ExbD [Planctomycetia bacterium]